MDGIDLQIVELLQSNGRISLEGIAREVNLSRPAVHERVKRLEQEGVIRGYKAEVDWSALGKPLTAFISVHSAGANSTEVGKALLRLGNQQAIVEEGYHVTGEWCMLLKARVASPLALQALIDRIRQVPGVTGTLTTIALAAVHEDSGAERNDDQKVSAFY